MPKFITSNSSSDGSSSSQVNADWNSTEGVSEILNKPTTFPPESHTHVGVDITDLDIEISNNTDVASNTSARHTHSNKSVLDGTTASYTTAEKTKLSGIESGATGDMTSSEILTSIKTVDGSGSGLDSDLLDGHEGTYYLDFTNATNKPDPTITLGGDLTGSVTLTDLASGTLTATVVDDSHNHIIANIDGLQTALDGKVDDSQVLTNVPVGAVFTDTVYTHPTGFTSEPSTPLTGANVISQIGVTTEGHVDTVTSRVLVKGDIGLGNVDNTSDLNKPISTATQTALDAKLSSSSYTASDILTKIKTVDGSGSGLDADLLEGQQGSYYTNTANLTEPNYVTGSITKTAKPLFDVLRGDRTAFLPETQIIIEKSTDAGVTWVDAGVSDTVKRQLFCGSRPSINLPLLNGIKSCNCMIRITITGMRYNETGSTGETDRYNYWNSTYVQSTERYFAPTDGWAWVSSNTDHIYLKVERATGVSHDTWVLDKEAYFSGWSGGNYFSLSGSTFGGGTSQTSNAWNWRFTFRTCSPTNTFNDADLSTSYTTSAQTIYHLKITGQNVWNYTNNYMYNEHLYSWDYLQNVIFPADLKATTLTSTVATGTSPLNITSTTKVVNLNVDKLDDQEGSYYLDWTNMTNKPDPTITLGGDLTGSVTLTDLASGTLTASVVDDSHNHIISNVDGLQTALDGKEPTITKNTAFNVNFETTATNIKMDGTQALGALSTVARADHVHPSDTSRVPTTRTVNGHALSANVSVTASDVGLGNVTNESKATMFTNPTLTGVPTAPTATQGTNTTQIATTAFVQNALGAVGAGDMLKSTYDKDNDGIVDDAMDLIRYSTYKTGLDSEGIYTTVQHKRADGTLIISSVLSGGTTPQYTTRTETKYASDGTTIQWTKTYTITYDVNGNISSEVMN